MHLHQSNRLENLLAQLWAILQTPQPDPLQLDRIVVQNQGMARWVSQQLALHAGIAANLDFPLPARFVWDIFQSHLGVEVDNNTYDRGPLLWRIFTLLGTFQGTDQFQPLNRYLADDPSRTKRYQLARTIADTFDQYLVYRPDMLATWEQGEKQHWQAMLWRSLVAENGLHRGRLLHDYLMATEGDKAEPTRQLPERVCLFGLNTLAPAYLEVMHRLSRRTEVHLFHLSPCRQFWGDLVSARQQARLRLQGSTGQQDPAEAYYEQGNPLLAAMGRVAQDFCRQLMDYDIEEQDFYQENDQSSLLAFIQNDILDMIDRTMTGQPQQALPDHGSIVFHNCHSPMREVQVLHDRLLDRFTDQPELTPGDVLVMAPDIEQYADAIRGVFGGTEATRHIPWAIADRSLLRESRTIAAFLTLLELFSGRCTASDILGLLETEAVQHRFHLDREFLERIHTWVRESGIRWGLNRDHQQRFSDNPSYRHTWKFGIDRLLLGYLMHPGSCGYSDIAAYHGSDANESEIIGEISSLILEVTRWQSRLQQAVPAADWCGRLLEMVDTFFHPDCDPAGLQTLRAALQEFGRHCTLANCIEPLNLETIRYHFQQHLLGSAGGEPFLSGRVTFCNMVPMRSVPFKILCLLGMNDDSFPRSQQPVNFDFMASQPRIGDRNRRYDDRYLFLEALLSARDQLYISWIGRDQRNNAPIPPSVVVSELQDYIDSSFIVANGSCCETLTTEHPLQPFSVNCFDGTPGTASYACEWLPVLTPGNRQPFLSGPLTEPVESCRQITVKQLTSFWCHPVRYFLHKRLGLFPGESDQRIDDTEPFHLDQLQQFILCQDLTDRLLRGQESTAVKSTYTTSGQLPRQPFGSCQFAAMEQRSEQLLSSLQPLTSLPKTPVAIDLRTDGFHLTGSLTDLYSQGRITWRNSQFNATAHLQAWVGHLLLNYIAPQGVRPVTIHVARDRSLLLTPVDHPVENLRLLLDWYWQGLMQPLPFYPATSLAWLQAASPEQKERNALRSWQTTYGNRGEEEDECYRLVLGDASPFCEKFEQLATLFLPMIEHTEQYSAVP